MLLVLVKKTVLSSKYIIPIIFLDITNLFLILNKNARL